MNRDLAIIGSFDDKHVGFRVKRTYISGDCIGKRKIDVPGRYFPSGFRCLILFEARTACYSQINLQLSRMVLRIAILLRDFVPLWFIDEMFRCDERFHQSPQRHKDTKKVR